jgi:hypothetical protein
MAQKVHFEKFLYIGHSVNSVIEQKDVFTQKFWTYKFSPLLIGMQFYDKQTEKLEFCLDLYYVRKGAWSFIKNGYRSQDYIFDYIIISPQIRWQLFKPSRLKVKFGPYYGIATLAKSKFYRETKFRNFRDYSSFKPYDMGINFSISQQFNVENYEFFIEPKFQLGLIKFSNTKHISFQLIFGAKL